MTTQQQDGVSPAWYSIIIFLVGACVLVVDQAVRPLLPWLAWPLICVAGAGISVVASFLQMDGGRVEGTAWLRVFSYRIITWVALATLTAWVDLSGWTTILAASWLGVVLALAGVGHFCPTPPPQERDPHQTPGLDLRPDYARRWEQLVRAVSGWKTVRVSRWERWENSADGFRLWVELPVESGKNVSDLAPLCDNLGSSARLPDGCHVQALPSGIQGVAVLDVMTRDSLIKSDGLIHSEPAEPASINDDFTVMTSPRGQALNVCLRIETVTIGGATGSGKTTLMNRIIMHLARCTDCVLWIADYNGGGLANGWVEPWAQGKCAKPVVDWVASDENEFALMTTVAREISTARKGNPEVRRRIREARSGGVLPVDAQLPAIIVLADEGGSLQQKLTAIGQIAAEGLSQLAQLGRAMGVRAMVSVLRGTSDLMDKGFRTQSSIRLCLRMNEWSEYIHVLDASPPKTQLIHKGSAYLKTMENLQPIYGRTVNVDEDAIEQHAIACSGMRPNLDQHALKVAAKVRPSDVVDKDYPGWAGSIQYLHALDGKAYTGRWERAAALLADLRGDDFNDAEPVLDTAKVEVVPQRSATPVLDALMAVQAPPASARGRMVAALRDAGEDGLSASELEQASGVSKQRMYQLLNPMMGEENVVQKNSGGRYVLVHHMAHAN